MENTENPKKRVGKIMYNKIIVWIINTVAVLRSTKQKKRALIENSLL